MPPTVDPSPPDPAEVWTRTLAALSVPHPAQTSDDARHNSDAALIRRASAALEALPDDHPRALEVLCEAATSEWFARDARALWTRAAAIDARRPSGDRQARHASLSRDTLRLAGQYVYTSYESPRTSQISRAPELRVYSAVSLESCADLDHAALLVMLARHLGPGLEIHEQLYHQVEQDLGAESPELATVLELGHALCSSVSDTPACPPPLRRFERALQLRERALGSDHPLTHASRLNLAMILEHQGDSTGAADLLRRIEASPVRDMTAVLALRELAWHDIRGKRWGLASDRMCAASRRAHELPGTQEDPGLRASTLDLCAHLLTYAGHYGEAQEAFRLARAEVPRGHDPRLRSYQLAELLREGGDHEQAIPYYDEFLAANNI